LFLNFFNISKDEIIFIGTNEYLYMHVLKFKDDQFEVDEIPKEKLSKFYFIFPTNHFFGKGILSNNQKIIQTIQIDSLSTRCIVLYGLNFSISHFEDFKFFIFQYVNQNEYELSLQGVVEDSKGMKLFSINKTPHLQHRMSMKF
jgi:hypothetical protein